MLTKIKKSLQNIIGSIDPYYYFGGCLFLTMISVVMLALSLVFIFGAYFGGLLQ